MKLSTNRIRKSRWKTSRACKSSLTKVMKTSRQQSRTSSKMNLNLRLMRRSNLFIRWRTKRRILRSQRSSAFKSFRKCRRKRRQPISRWKKHCSLLAKVRETGQQECLTCKLLRVEGCSVKTYLRSAVPRPKQASIPWIRITQGLATTKKASHKDETPLTTRPLQTLGIINFKTTALATTRPREQVQRPQTTGVAFFLIILIKMSRWSNIDNN